MLGHRLAVPVSGIKGRVRMTRWHIDYMPQDSRVRQIECDLPVVGSGAAGLSAATTAAWHGLSVVVVEKDQVCGGATAWSGGWAWVPLLDAGRHMVAFFEQNTALQFVSGTWIADIQGHVPGAGTGGRSVGPKPINGRALGGTCWISCDRSCTRPRSWAWASWRGLTCRRSCTLPAHRGHSPTLAGGSGSMPLTWPLAGRGCRWSTAWP